MSLKSTRVIIWTCICFTLLSCEENVEVTNSSTKLKDGTSYETVGNCTTHIVVRTSSRSPYFWRNGKLPARPPRLRSYHKSTTTTVTPSTTVKTLNFVDKSDEPRRRIDIIEPSSSDHHPRSVVWPVRQRPALASKRFRAPTPTTPAPQVLLKLLQPKPTRPAIYSLDGFVPKPSLKKIVPSSTEPPYLYSRNDLQLLPSVIRRRKINRVNKDDEDEDIFEEPDQKSRKKAVSRYTAFARKGVPGEDFPVFGFIPQTEFQCGEQPGLYADRTTKCQVWHMCPGGHMAPRHSFLCPNGTIFNQKKRICDWWYNVDCQKHSRGTRAVVVELFPLPNSHQIVE